MELWKFAENNGVNRNLKTPETDVTSAKQAVMLTSPLFWDLCHVKCRPSL